LFVGVPGRRGARRPDGTFAEAPFAVPPSGADPPAAALADGEDGPEVDLRSGTASPRCWTVSIVSWASERPNEGTAVAPQGQPITATRAVSRPSRHHSRPGPQ